MFAPFLCFAHNDNIANSTTRGCQLSVTSPNHHAECSKKESFSNEGCVNLALIEKCRVPRRIRAAARSTNALFETQSTKCDYPKVVRLGRPAYGFAAGYSSLQMDGQTDCIVVGSQQGGSFLTDLE